MSAVWTEGVKGLLLDVTGVLYESGPGGGTVIPGSVDAINRYSNELHRVQYK